MAEVSRGESFESSFARAAKLAKKKEPGQTPNNACYQVGSKRNSRQAIQIVREPERDRAETQQDHNFPPFLFHGGIDGAERRMPPQPDGYLIAQEPTGQAEPTRSTQCDTGDRSQNAKRKAEYRRSSYDEWASRKKKKRTDREQEGKQENAKGTESANPGAKTLQCGYHRKERRGNRQAYCQDSCDCKLFGERGHECWIGLRPLRQNQTETFRCQFYFTI